VALVAVILAYTAGATDAFAFLQLGGVFTANMTGNLVLAGLIERPGYGSSLAAIVTAILVFAAALFLALRFMPAQRSQDRAGAVLVVSALAQLGVFGLWVVRPEPTAPLAIVPFIALSTIAMACQTAVAKRLDAASGVTTTYVTGTITSLMSDAADLKPQPARVRLGVIAALVLGALCDAALLSINPLFGAALPVVSAVVAVSLTLKPHAIPATREGAIP
jgi:uncharacterized membrane protein YoaK (UPF0700 family)